MFFFVQIINEFTLAKISNLHKRMNKTSKETRNITIIVDITSKISIV